MICIIKFLIMNLWSETTVVCILDNLLVSYTWYCRVCNKWLKQNQLWGNQFSLRLISCGLAPVDIISLLRSCVLRWYCRRVVQMVPRCAKCRIAECIVGDETGAIVFTARNEQGIVRWWFVSSSWQWWFNKYIFDACQSFEIVFVVFSFSL